MEAAIHHAAVILGVKELRQEQKKVVFTLMDGRHDVFVSLPTGFGKSFCFQCLPLIHDYLSGQKGSSIVLVVQPTAAIMRDHVEAALLSKDLSAAFINHEQKDSSIRQRVLEGKYQYVYISPETLTENQPYRNMLLTEAYKLNLVALAIDEAHTVTSWYVVWMQLLLLASYNCLLSF